MAIMNQVGGGEGDEDDEDVIVDGLVDWFSDRLLTNGKPVRSLYNCCSASVKGGDEGGIESGNANGRL